MAFDERLGIIVGSLLSGVLGYAILTYSLPSSKKVTPNDDMETDETI